LVAAYFLTRSSDRLLFCLALLSFIALIATVYFYDAIERASQIFLAVFFALLAYSVANTGGINSPVLAWMALVPVSALMLLNNRWCYFWLGVTLIHHVAEFFAIQGHWISADMNVQVLSPGNALLLKINLIMLIMLAVTWYEVTFRVITRRLASRTQKLGDLQSKLRATRTQVDMYLNALGAQLRVPLSRLSHLMQIPSLERTVGEQIRREIPQIQNSIEHLHFFVDDLVHHTESDDPIDQPGKLGATESAPTPTNILLIGNHSNELSVMTRTLRNVLPQAKLGLAESVSSGLLQLEFSSFDMVLIEVGAANIDALEATRQIRLNGNRNIREVRIIGLVSPGGTHLTEDCLAAGMQWLIFQPWTEKIMFHALSAHLI
jgi:CheY-like chemotaxis protein